MDTQNIVHAQTPTERLMELIDDAFAKTHRALEILCDSIEDSGCADTDRLAQGLMLVNHQGLHADWDLIYLLSGIERYPEGPAAL